VIFNTYISAIDYSDFEKKYNIVSPDNLGMDKFWGVIAELKRIHPFGVQGHYKTLHQA
jgi:hypothetical protein